MSSGGMLEALRRFAAARFLISGIIGIAIGFIFVGIVWLLIQTFRLVT